MLIGILDNGRIDTIEYLNGSIEEELQIVLNMTVFLKVIDLKAQTINERIWK